MQAQEIQIDLAQTGGKMLPTGNVTSEQLKDFVAGKKPTPSPQPEPPKTDPEPPKVDPVVVCRHCNWPSNVDPTDPTQDDIYAFSQSVWRDDRFTRAVPFFGAAAEVAFRTLTSGEEEAVKATVDRELAEGKLVRDGYAILNRLGELRLPLAVSKLRVGGYVCDRPPPDDPLKYDLATEFTLLRKGPLKNDAVYTIVGQQFAEFFRVAEALTRRALDKSFWQAADRAGYSPDSPPPATQG